MTTANMGLTLPVPGSTSGGATSGYLWAAELTASLEAIDAHNHTSGSGARVPTSGLDINAALSFGDYDATRLRSTRYTTQGSTFSASDDVNAVYVYGGDLYYRNTGGTNVQVTSGGSVNAAGLSAILFAGSNKSADFTIGAGDNYAHYRVDATAAVRTATLPLASGVADGRFYYIERTAGTNNITVAQAGASSDTVNGAASYTFGGGTYAAALVIRISSTAWVAIPLGQQLNGASVPEAGSLTTGNVLQVSGSRALTYGAVNLAGGSDYVSGVLPSANMFQATTGTSGAVKLTNDLAGSAATPTVVGLTGASNKTVIRDTSRTLEWAATTTQPKLTVASTAGAGANVSVIGQPSSADVGGDGVLSGGTSAGGSPTGGAQITFGDGSYGFRLREVVAGRKVLGVFGDVDSALINDGGNYQMFIADTSSAGANAAAGGFRFMASGGVPRFITSAGDIVELTGSLSTTATAGSNSQPTLVVGFLRVKLGSTSYKIPYYNV